MESIHLVNSLTFHQVIALDFKECIHFFYLAPQEVSEPEKKLFYGKKVISQGVCHLKHIRRKPTIVGNLRRMYPVADLSSRTFQAFPSPFQKCGIILKHEKNK